MARMLVPKMVRNGFDYVASVRVISRGLDSEWKSGTSTETKRGIKTILDQFRNKHARSLAGWIKLYPNQVRASIHLANGLDRVLPPNQDVAEKL